jgi:multiple sugar transport system substrate-binding protein
MPHPISRRTLLGTGAAALAAPAVLAQGGAQRITFAFAPDESGAIQALIDGFNASQGEVEVVWREAPEESDAFFRTLVSDFEAGATDLDVFGADVIWTPELAENDWVRDVSGRLYDDLPTEAMLGAALQSASFRNRFWAVPWYTDAGMLYYRRDLLEEAGLGPPGTWSELAETARTVMEASGLPHGFVFQGGRYEGGVTNALEFIWSAGGRAWTPQSEVAGAFGLRVSDPNVIVLNSEAAVAGLAAARSLVADGIAPEEVSTFNERDALRVFAAGEAVFMRNWPFAYGLLGTEEFAGITPDQVGIAQIPTLAPEGRSYSCLGGWNLAISRSSRNEDAAWSFIRHAVDAERQREMAMQGGFLPTLTDLYDDEALREAVPVIGLGADALRSARARPASTIYSRLSPRLAIMFNRVLRGEIEPAEAVRTTEAELRRITRRRAI